MVGRQVSGVHDYGFAVLLLRNHWRVCAPGFGILNLTGQPGIVITLPASDTRVRTSPECLYPTIREIPQSIAEVLIRDAAASVAHVEGGESLK